MKEGAEMDRLPEVVLALSAGGVTLARLKRSSG